MRPAKTQSDYFMKLGGGGYIDDLDEYMRAATGSLGPMSSMAPPASLTEAAIRRGYEPGPLLSSLYSGEGATGGMQTGLRGGGLRGGGLRV